mmetsp:Transcript_44558/g.127760  ORF Transcript_44558/g.127760 Transcript_44558/m.127760 type:complete len:242 (-) Transcript_44558:41-766(-)
MALRYILAATATSPPRARRKRNIVTGSLGPAIPTTASRNRRVTLNSSPRCPSIASQASGIGPPKGSGSKAPHAGIPAASLGGRAQRRPQNFGCATGPAAGSEDAEASALRAGFLLGESRNGKHWPNLERLGDAAAAAGCAGAGRCSGALSTAAGASFGGLSAALREAPALTAHGPNRNTTLTATKTHEMMNAWPLVIVSHVAMQRCAEKMIAAGSSSSARHDPPSIGMHQAQEHAPRRDAH